MRTYLPALFFAGLVCHCLAAQEPRIYFQENFRNYRDVAPNCAENLGIVIGNDPIWTQSAEANCRMKESGFVFKEFMPSAGIMPPSTNYDVLFRFRFQSDDARKFELRLRTQRQDKQTDIVVTISSIGIKVSSEDMKPLINAEVGFAQEILKNEWRQCAATIQDGKLRVFIDEQRILRQVVDIVLPSHLTGSINFYGYKDSSFSLSNIVVRECAPLPDNRIARLLPAPRKLDDAIYKTGAQQKEVSVSANDIFGATFRTGLEKSAVKISVNWADGKKDEIVVGATGMPAERRIKKDGKDVIEKYELPDAILDFRGIGGKNSQLKYHVRPLLRRYHTSYSFTDTYYDILRDWELLPKASEQSVKAELRSTHAGLDLYLNGCFAGSLSGEMANEVIFTLAPTASIKDVFSIKSNYAASKYLPLDIAPLGMAKSFADSIATVKAGMGEVQGIPMRVASGRDCADIGLAREGQGNWALEVDEYLARSPFDGLLSEIHFTVPSAVYTKAWVLCAVDSDPAKDPILTTRLARYVESGCGNNTLADTVLILPRGNDPPGEGIRQVGTVSRNGKDVPLYLIEVPLKSGEICDLLMTKPFLNFEFFGKPWENFEQLDNSSKPDPQSTSAVQIFGVTLEKSPVGLSFIQSQPANIFHNNEKPETTAVLHSFAPAIGKIAWDILDIDGKRVGGESVDYSFSKEGNDQDFNIPLTVPEVGWYELRISVLNESGHALLIHPARFALLGKDERKAKYDSPYGIWYFDGVHGTPASLDFGGPILFKAGIRKVAWTSQKEKAMEKWFLSKDQVNMPFRNEDLKNPEEAIERASQTMKKHLADYPHLREVLVFHESGPGNDIPVELIGLKPSLTEAQVTREKRYADLFNFSGYFFRKNYPQLKLVVGNNSCSQACIAAVFRHGGKPEYMDYIGIEAPSQVYIPEKLQEWSIQGLHIAKETAKTLSGRDIPATGCYEFTYRSERDMGEQQHAEWYTRDVLISLANNFTRTGPGILFDCSNAYYNGLWGGSGILKRGPYGYPKKAYVAYATLTNVLDQVTLRRQVPTGSTTVYALEFDRSDKKQVLALWASRGDVEFILEYASEVTVKVIDMYGRSREQRSDDVKIHLKGGTAPIYVVSEKAISSITLGNRSFPKDEMRVKSAVVAAALDNADLVSLDLKDSRIDTPLAAPLQLPIRQIGDFELRQAQDEKMGACIELELKTGNKKSISKYITEYATVRLKQPVVVGGNPAALGIWVKGNSNWGRILFEIEDRDGEIWRSVGTGGWGCDVLDWPGNLAVNFDGWNFVSIPLRDTSLFNDHSPGPVLEQWVSDGGNKKIDIPIKVRALMVEMNRKALDLIDFKDSKRAIRLKGLSGIEEPGKK